MKRLLAFAVAPVLPMLVTVGCGGSPAPTHPSTTTPANTALAPMTEGATAVVPWSCLVRNASPMPGIFSSAINDAGCPVRFGTQSVRSAADAAPSGTLRLWMGGCARRMDGAPSV